MKLLSLLATLLVAFSTPIHAADDVEYTPGGSKWAAAWKAFYNNEGSESELMDPLIAAGPTMAPSVAEAITHKDMKLRRYAIGALGHLKDPAAIAPLTVILEDKSEADWFRGDAIIAIYQIDSKRGEELAKKFNGTGKTEPDLDSVLNMNCTAILNKEPWLTEGL